MIPYKIQIKNFLSYGPETQTIDFWQHRLICLSGKNGHGKSALLDAITWALWGQARKTTTSVKPDADLLHLGQSLMTVIFDFELNGSMYRVRREFGKNHNKAHAVLEFGMLNPDTDKLIPLTDKTIKLTQEKIHHTLNLDYESFVNSAFLRQGSSNEFSKKSPKERKEILATILGLNRYELIRKQAMEKIKTATQERITYQALQEKIILELEKNPQLSQAMASVCTQIDEIINHEKQLAIEAQALLHQEKTYSQHRQQEQMIDFELKKLAQEIDKKKQECIDSAQAWRAMHHKLIELPDQKKLEADYQQLQKIIHEHQQQLQTTLELKDQYLKIKEQLQQIEHTYHQQYTQQEHAQRISIERLTNQQHNHEKSILDFTATIDTLTSQQALIKQEKDMILNDLSHVHKELSQSAIIEAQFEKRKAFYQRMNAQGNFLSSQLKELTQKNALVHDENNPSCPLCEQNLSASRRRFLKQQFNKKSDFIQHQLERISRAIKTLKPLLITQNEEVKAITLKKELIQTYHVRLEQHEKTLIKTNELIAQTQKSIQNEIELSKKLSISIALAQKVLQEFQLNASKGLLNSDAYTQLLNQKTSIELKARNTIYNQEAHKKAIDDLASREQQRVALAQSEHERARQKERMADVAQRIIILKKLHLQKQELLKQANAFSGLNTLEQTLIHKRNQLEQQRVHYQKEKERLLEQKGTLTAQQEKLKQLENEYKALQKSIADLNNTTSDYQIISTALGKDGIQALLIEEAIPEIEQEANELLGRLTNNQAHVFLESLRDLKGGGTKETLDIKISDSAGIRPYELFSGGEAFRIDFALRIAISKLLARRAGTALQTLIIDEGFGSQDDDGLNYIMDAIHKIQDDFAKIIIVSHLPTMKDQFPVHFVIEKKPFGSQVRVIEQG